MSYAFTAYFNDAGISSTTIYAMNEGVTYTRSYGASQLSFSGFTGGMRFTATPATGKEFYRWVYRLGSVSGEVQYSYSNSFDYFAGQDIFIRAESQDEGGVPTSWTMESSAKGTVSELSETYINLSAYVLKRYSVRFTKSGTATFYSTGAFDTRGYLSTASTWDSANGVPTSILTQNDDGGENQNFSFEYEVTAGTTYYVWLRMYNPTVSGQLALHIAPPGTSPTTGGGGFYIFTGGQWVKVQPYVHNGASWKAATPCIYNGGWYQAE